MHIIFTGIVGIVLTVLLGLAGYFFFVQRNAGQTILKEEINKEESQIPSLKLVDFSKVNSTFRFSGKIPVEFEVEYIPQLRALSIYDPSLPGENVREKSQIYISSFGADRFLTLSTVDITQQDETLLNGRDAVLYEITKKAGVPDFTQQPSWRNSKHKALDVRFTESNPSVFYSFAYDPELLQALFDQFIYSLKFHEN